VEDAYLPAIFDEVAEQMRSDLRMARFALQHPGLKGSSFENTFRKFLRQYLPRNLDMSTGGSGGCTRKSCGESISSYSPVHAEWYQDPDAVMPGEVLTHAAGPEDRRRAYRRYGARFEVDGEGELTLRLDLNLDGGVMNLTSTRC
jgi:hypothetical protein